MGERGDDASRTSRKRDQGSWGQAVDNVQWGGGIFRQVKFAVINFEVGNFAEPPGFDVGNLLYVLLVCEFTENPEFRMGNFTVNLKRGISHAKLKCHEPPPPPCNEG